MSRAPVATGLTCPPNVRGCIHPQAGPGQTFVGGYNDAQPRDPRSQALAATEADETVITGSVGSAANTNAGSLVPSSSSQSSSDGDPPTSDATPADPTVVEPLDLTTPPDSLPPQTAEPSVAIAPALRLSPTTPQTITPDASEPPLPLAGLRGTQAPVPPGESDAAAESQPLDLADTQGDAPAAMSDPQEVELRASTSPLDLDPPVVNASIQAPAATSADAVAEAEAEAFDVDQASEGAPDEFAALPGGQVNAQSAPVRQFTGDISVTGDSGSGPLMTLPEIVSRAATMHPEVTLALARVDEAKASVERAQAGFAPQVDLRVATGEEANMVREPFIISTDQQTADSGMRLDASIRLRQLLFDFNVTRDDLLSNIANSDSSRLRAIDTTEDIALRTAQAYLSILQQRQLLALIDRNISEHLKLLEIVRLNEADGNSTMADVNRVSARLSEVRSARTDLAAELDAAEDAFERLARMEPGRLRPPEPVIAMLAPNAEQAVERAIAKNPSLLSLAFSLRSLQHQLDVVNGDGRARIDLEVEANTRNTISDNARSENDVRGMVVFSYRLFDGGNNEGEQRQVEARIRQARARYTDRRDQVEAEIRQAYRAIASARRKLTDLRDGLRSSREVQAVYTEQFQAGERTIFELLDAQNALFSSERDLIVSQFSELEAAYSVLRSTGGLTAAILGSS